MSSPVITTAPPELTKRSGCGGARSYVATVAQAISPNVTTATASKIHFSTLLTGSSVLDAETLVWFIPIALRGKVTSQIQLIAHGDACMNPARNGRFCAGRG